MDMARSQTPTDDTAPDPTYDTGTLEPPTDDAAKREQRACNEPMVVIPAFDQWGIVPKPDPTYRVATASGSVYDVDPRAGDDCMDSRMNQPDNGCKHTRRVVRQLNAGTLPAPDQPVDDYFHDDVLASLTEFADDYQRLTAGMNHPETDTGDYAEPREAVAHFLAVLGDAYRDYRSRTDADTPPLTDAVDPLPEPATE
jgi:hypothetical protein